MKFISLIADETRKEILINREYIVSMQKENSRLVIVSLSNGDKVKVTGIYDELKHLVETGSPFEHTPVQKQG